MASHGEVTKLRTRKAEKGLDKRPVEEADTKRRRYMEIVETSSRNQKLGDRRQPTFEVSNLDLFTKTEMVLIREVRDMKKWLQQLTTSSPSLESSYPKQYFRKGKNNDQEHESVQQGSLPTKIPKWMSISFKPPQGMRVSNTESEVAAYIFMSTEILEGKEILVRSKCGGKFGIGDRLSLQTLRPSNYVCNEVITLVVCMMTNYRDLSCDFASSWFLPPKFTQQFLEWKATPFDLSHRYRTSFMGYVDLITKIFLPVNDQDLHWYLVVIDLQDEQVLLLDSNPDLDRRECNDCGVLVAKWMMESKDENNYERITLNHKSRMRLALDLVLDKHNIIKDEVVNIANTTLTTFIGAWAVLDSLTSLRLTYGYRDKFTLVPQQSLHSLSLLQILGFLLHHSLFSTSQEKWQIDNETIVYKKSKRESVDAVLKLRTPSPVTINKHMTKKGNLMMIMSKVHQRLKKRSEVPTNPCFIPSSSNAHNPQVPPPPVIIPKWMPLLFRPPPDMELSETEAELAVYIFMNSHVLDGKEILVLSLDGLALGDRKTLRTILPTSNISNQFMMMVVCMLTHYKNLLCEYATCWFLPPRFSELALNNKKSVAELSKDYKDSFMGYVDLIKKAIIIEEMLMDRSFYELSSYECPVISDFTLIEPEGLSQNLTSYHDCGVQVARWMTECISHDNYQSIGVNAESRMRLALDLVLDMHNQLRNETVRKAHMKFKVFIDGWDNSDDI
ncbi:Ulp1 protease family, C-terminal catalytic domain [Sesbania bispinosa]|nr:Ulp1 protease family, C-terminal catalytic domain [Sesbania bispinosa]